MLQPKKIRKNKVALWKNFYKEDFFIAFAILAISFTTGYFSIPNSVSYYNYIRIAFIFILILIFLPLLIYIPSQSARIYVIIWRGILFKAENKKFTKNNKNSNTSNLIVYEKIEDNLVKLKPNLINKNRYFAVLKLDGFNVWQQTKNEKENLIYQFQNFLNSLEETKISFVKKKEFQNYDIINNNLTEKLLKLSEIDPETISEKHSKSFQYFFNRKKDIEKLETEELIDAYYLIIYNFSKEILQERVFEYLSELQKFKLFGEQLNNNELLFFLNSFLVPYQEKKLIEEDNNTNFENIDEIIKPESIAFYANHIKVNDYYVSLNTITDLSINLNYGWLDTLFNSDSTVIWHLKPIDVNQYQNIIDKSTRNLYSSLSLNKRSFFKRKKDNDQLEAIEEITELITADNQRLFENDLFFISYANNIVDLKNIEKQNEKNLRIEKCQINKLMFRQMKALDEANLNISTHKLNEHVEIVARNLAWSWPFTFEKYNDGNSFIIGKSGDNPIIFDLWKRNWQHINSNMVIFGLSGSGKTTAMQKIMLNEFLENDASIIVLDPQREYGDFVSRLDGNWIDLGSSKTSLNPLQINVSISDIDNKKTKIPNEFLISNQIKKFLEWIKILKDDLNDDFTYLLIKSLNKLYSSKKYDFFNSNIRIADLKNDDYPTISELIYTLKNLSFDDEYENKMYKSSIIKLKNWFETNFEENGIYSCTYNNHTTVDLSNDFSIIDTKLLTDSQNGTALNAAFYQLLNFIQNKINENFFKYNKKTILVVDEAHFFIDTKNMTTLDFIFSTVKTIRKYNGSIILTTQNPTDFALNNDVINKTNGILKNMQYSILFKLTGDDIQKINLLYNPNRVSDDEDSKNFINNIEEEYLQRASKGQNIFVSAIGKKVKMRMFYNQYEQELLFKENPNEE